jgi:hypothetical protein
MAVIQMTMRHSQLSFPPTPSPGRAQRFFGGWGWLILRNAVGWPLILASFVTGPLVPGPGGSLLFLVGFALASFPGKRRLTARVLRGSPVQFHAFAFGIVSFGVALLVPCLLFVIFQTRPAWIEWQRGRGPVALTAMYLLIAAASWLTVRSFPHASNVVLWIAARARRRIRPRLRHHHIHLLPPRRRPRLPHESGKGPFPLSDEILKFYRLGRSNRIGAAELQPKGADR